LRRYVIDLSIIIFVQIALLSIIGVKTKKLIANKHAKLFKYLSDNNMEFLKDLWLFLKERKKFWLLPIVLILLLLGILIVFGGGSAAAPFIYTIF